MSNKPVLEDPLKPLDQVYEPDRRQQSFDYELKDYHAALSNINLNDSAPIKVQQLFETAKNLSLYSWFVYRFHQTSELTAYSALEMALREKYIAENPEVQPKKRPIGLHKFMQIAKSERWITNEGFPSLYARAKQLAEHEKTIEVIKTHDFDKEPSHIREEASEAEIEMALMNLDIVDAITSNASKIRNDLAHGSSTLHPDSISTLTIISEVVNQIYS